jgi:serpin B
MMGVEGTFAYAAADDVEIVELPYEGDDLSMWIVLPRAGVDLADVEATLAPSVLDAWARSLDRTSVDVRLPKFTLDAPALDLKPALSSLGLGVLFDGSADLSGLGSASLALSAMFQRVLVQVDEASTEASAVTVGVGTSTAMPGTIDFVADRPFLFLVRDVGSGMVLFAGRIVDPSTPAPALPGYAARP